MRHADRFQDRYKEDRYEEDRYVDPYGETDGADERAWDDPWAEAAPRHATRAYRTVRAPRHDDYGYDDELDYDDEDVAAPVLSPARAKTRRKRIVIGLAATIVATFVLGLLPGLGLLWAVTLVAVLVLAGYLALMFYASNAGLYGHDALERLTPVARTVIAPYPDQVSRYDDDRWQPDRIAAAR